MSHRNIVQYWDTTLEPSTTEAVYTSPLLCKDFNDQVITVAAIDNGTEEEPVTPNFTIKLYVTSIDTVDAGLGEITENTYALNPGIWTNIKCKDEVAGTSAVSFAFTGEGNFRISPDTNNVLYMFAVIEAAETNLGACYIDFAFSSDN